MNLRKLGVVCLLLLPAACGRIQKTRECRRFATMVNRGLDDIDARLKVKSAGSYRAGSRSYTALSAELRKNGKNAPADFAVEEFAQVFDSAAHAASSYADALDAKDTRQQEDARRELERLSRHEQSLVLRVNGHCEAP